MANPFVWVVEMYVPYAWEPTVGAAISRADGRQKLAHWKLRNPNDRFRLQKYVRKESSK